MTDTVMEASPDLGGFTGAPKPRPAHPLDAAETKRLPGVDMFAIESAPVADRNPIYRELVGDKPEVVDLLAYAVYKQHKHDFREAFYAANERDPTAAELAAYIIGESTPRRLAAYRFLAAAKLAGGEGSAPASQVAGAASLPARGRKKSQWRQVALLTTMLLGLIALASIALKMR